VAQLKLTTAYFGKLQRYGDFIQFGESNQDFERFEQWMQEGLSLCQKRFDNDYQKFFDISPDITFFYHEGATLFSGKWRPSRDEIGRRYPFMVYGKIDETELTTLPVVEQLLLFSPLLRQAGQWLDSALSGAQKDEISRSLALFSQQEFSTMSAADHYLAFKRTTLIGDFFRAYNEKFGQGFRLNMLKCFKLNLLNIPQPERQNIGFGFKIPLCQRSIMPEMAVAFFVEMINRIGENFIQKLYFFIAENQQEQSVNAYIFFIKPPIQLFLNFLNASLEIDAIEDVVNAHLYADSAVLDERQIDIFNSDQLALDSCL